MPETLDHFFRRITGKEPLPYQMRYGATPFLSTLLIIPTGLGKTDAVLTPWLHAVSTQAPGTPRRFAYVLPRRNLTEQTADIARKRVAVAGLENVVDVFELMGSSSDNRATVRPDRHTLLIGTQDIIVSRALNRGYARRPQRWPIDFALLNNDALWVVDEVQLTAESLATSTQLAAFRKTLGVFGPVPCVWMSATVDPAWLDTVDFASSRPTVRVVQIEREDRTTPIVQRRIHACKTITPAPESCRMPKACAEFVSKEHQPGQRTLVVVNTVRRAREIAIELRKRKCEPILLHSRFRPADRKRQFDKLNHIPPEGQVVVSTQVLEAGVDISAHRLVTDIAPWGSLVQRFGRVNRYGDEAQSQIWWVDRPLTANRESLSSGDLKEKDRDEIFRPYMPDEVDAAAMKLAQLTSAAPADLPPEDGPAPWQHVLRKGDLLDLFDTSSDISGNELDISRFIRAGEDKDCYLAWRVWKADEELANLSELTDEEFCPVPIGDMARFAKGRDLRKWDFAERRWTRIDPKRLWPGMIILVQASAGGYTEEEGWNPDSKKPVPPVQLDNTGRSEEGDEDDPLSWVSYRQTLQDHTRMVMEELSAILHELSSPELLEFHKDLQIAAAKHDWGKAHPVMQATLHKVDEPDFNAPGFEFLAKQRRGDGARPHKRPHFRHELASALAMQASGDSDLAAYLAAAHHGRIRVSIRSMPGERDPGGEAIARGIVSGDRLPECQLTADLLVPALQLWLNGMELGLGDDGALSWTDRAIRLRDRLGPFRLAYLEMLLRSADERASEKKGREVAECAL